MYSKLPNLVLGFHGCDETVYEQVICQGKHLKQSENSYDWLGHGIYFWENSYERAWDWAQKSPKIERPAVIGAVIDLGKCLNLTDYASTEILKRGYAILQLRCQNANQEIPKNKPSQRTSDILLRDLDCAVIQQIHDFHTLHNIEPYDSVRGIFVEGQPIYPGSEFREKTHVQLCIVNPNCIKGYSQPLQRDKEYSLP